MVEIKIHYSYFILIFLNILFFFKLFSGEYTFSVEGDAYGHIFKFFRVCSNPFIQWDPYWYVGYPIFLYYPPLFYYISIIFCPLGLFGIKLLLFLVTFISTILTYEISKKFADKNFALILTLFYQFNFFKLKILNPEGNFPQYFSISLFPILILFVYNFENLDYKKLLLLSLFLSFISLIHITSGLFIFFSFLLLLPLIYKKKVFALWKKILFVLINYIILISPFYVPAILFSKYSYFLTFQQEPELLDIYKVPFVESLIYPIKGSWSNYIGLSIIFSEFPYNLISLFFIFLSSAIIKEIYFLPIINKIPIYRYLILSLFFAWIGGLFIKSRIKKISFSIFTVINILFAFSFLQFKEFKLSKEFMEIYEFIKNKNGIFRYWQPDVKPVYSFVSFSPILTKKFTFNGWFREGNPIFWEFSKLRNALLFNCTLLESFYKYNIKFVIVKKGSCAEIGLKNRLEKVFETKNYVIYENKNYTFIYPKINYTIIKFSDNEVEIKYITNVSGKYTISIGYHPLWKAFIDNKKTKIYKDPSGLISVYLPRGEHILKLKFEGTLKYYLLIPIYTFIMFLILNYKCRKR